MSSVEKLSIALTPEIAASVREAVDAGDYATSSEVIRDALRQWKERRDLHGYTVEELRSLWDEGISSGASADGGEFVEKLAAKYRAMMHERGGR